MPLVNSFQSSRLRSLDVFRGFTMFLLVAEFAGIFHHLIDSSLEGSLIYQIGLQFHHAEWTGLRFWDCIQPFFMFIVGVAIPYSYANRKKAGQSEYQINLHVYQRAFLLLLIGWALYCIDPGRIVWRFQNVLAQLSITYLIAFLVMNKSFKFQLIVSFAMLLVTELIYRYFPVEGFTDAFGAGKNFGAWFNILISGNEDGGHWAMFNAIPTTAHTIWGVLVGKWLMTQSTQKQKAIALVISGVCLIAVGLLLSIYTPVIKRISTSSFVAVTGGISVLSFAFFYWYYDILGKNQLAWFLAVVGMNPLFIYIFSHVGGSELIHKIVVPFTGVLTAWMPEWMSGVATGMVVLGLLWYFCYWLYKKQIFIRI